MEEQTEPNNQATDVVDGTKYNEVVEAHNALKIQKEEMDKKQAEMQKELEDMKAEKAKADETQTAKTEETQTNEWKAQQEAMDAKMKEMDQKIEEINGSRKGTVNPDANANILATPEVTQAQETIKKHFGDLDDVNPPPPGTMNAFGYYKNPSTVINSDKLGQALALSNRIQRDYSPESERNSADLIVNTKI